MLKIGASGILIVLAIFVALNSDAIDRLVHENRKVRPGVMAIYACLLLLIAGTLIYAVTSL